MRPAMSECLKRAKSASVRLGSCPSADKLHTSVCLCIIARERLTAIKDYATEGVSSESAVVGSADGWSFTHCTRHSMRLMRTGSSLASSRELDGL